MSEIEYVPRQFEGAEDHYDGDKWKRYWEGLDLDEDHGFIRCDECGQKVHCYSATRDNPGYNEHIGDGYIIFASQVVVCGKCICEAFDSVYEVFFDD